MSLRFAYDITSVMNLTDMLARLVKFDTVSGNNNQIHKAYKWIRQELEKLPVNFSIVRETDFESFLVTSQPTKHPKILLSAHIDVVPAFDKEQFRPKIRGKKMFGRGSYDMKSAIACYMKLFLELGDDLNKYNIGILLTPDEEIGGFRGTKAVLKNGWRAGCVILPDSGCAWKIERSAKGVYFAKLIVKGVSAHGSRPWEGKNAFYTAIDVVNELRDYFYDGCVQSEKSKYENTINIGKIAGGEATNKLIDHLEIDIDIRFRPTTTPQQIEMIFRRIEQKYPTVKFKKLLTAGASKTDLQNKYVQAFKKIAERYINQPVGFVDSFGSSDARFFNATNIPTILIQPKGGGHHGPNEWCDLEDLERFYDVIKEFVKRFSKTG